MRYLPLGRSESSLLQRTVGTGSPWTTQLNSTLSSASTTTLLGRFTKVGRSIGQHSSKRAKHHYRIQYIVFVGSEGMRLYWKADKNGKKSCIISNPLKQGSDGTQTDLIYSSKAHPSKSTCCNCSPIIIWLRVYYWVLCVGNSVFEQLKRQKSDCYSILLCIISWLDWGLCTPTEHQYIKFCKS